jgi:hypothetical protein
MQANPERGCFRKISESTKQKLKKICNEKNLKFFYVFYRQMTNLFSSKGSLVEIVFA